MKKKVCFNMIIILIFLLTAFTLSGCGQKASEKSDVFIRVDRDDTEAWKGELDNVRFLPEERMSASAQFSEDQFHDLAVQLKEESDTVWIVDCRLVTALSTGSLSRGATQRTQQTQVRQ